MTFPKGTQEQQGCIIPEIAVFEGRLFLNLRAYEVLKPLIENDGEFLPAIYENGEAYIFTPMNVAEDADALDTTLTRQNSWRDLENLVIREDKIHGWSIFRTKIENYRDLHCQEIIKEAVEKEQLQGLYITSDLGRIFPCERSDAAGLDG